MTVKLLKPQIAHDRTALQNAPPPPVVARIEIEANEYEIAELSGDGSAVIEYDGVAEGSQLLDTTVYIPFDDFTLSMPVTCEVIYFIAEAQYLGVHFVNLPKHRMHMLLSIIGSFNAGERVSAADVLQLVQDADPVAARHGDPAAFRSSSRPPSRFWEGLRRRVGAIAFFVLASAL